MNYYQRHLGDYYKDTIGLDLLGHGVYNALLDTLYIHERPIPADFDDACQAIGAKSKAEKKMLRYVLRRFFYLEEDGYHQSRVDETLANIYQGQGNDQGSSDSTRPAPRQAVGANAADRQKRYRERQRLAQQLHEQGVDVRQGASIKEMEAALALQKNTVTRDGNTVTDSVTRDVTDDVTRDGDSVTRDVTRDTPSRAHACGGARAEARGGAVLPITNNQYPEANKHTERDVTRDAVTRDAVTRDVMVAEAGAHPALPTQAGSICKALKAEGIGDVNPGHPTLTELIKAGAPEIEFVGAAVKAVACGKPNFAYVLGIVTNTRKQAKALEGQLHTGALPMPFAIAAGQVNKQEALEARNLAVAQAWVEKMRAQDQGASHAAV